MAELYRLGAHPFLMQHLNGHNLFGLDRKTHFQRIKAVLDDKEPLQAPQPRAHTLIHSRRAFPARAQ